ncbi:hybrid-cluster NAD(P)-dependent oxidoreductase [Shewanella sp. C32]|uniref:Hybrid-cluster NAD(P)-dependent oxidoreductase n=1 Tax=Shewanella electrica TaxID=515560 RepID=A0ABT2FQ01_9GAMM|nr:hybrid-cluster NAD(P)-dependent oxidoreductase [Shewanella electrica]MCH1926303.1 hybrid-cluster NAD(P)-dependent oxidoreductase [Shewanella electrica]MCS4557730.1 hybrid-cluster NAD(P)-dependent oxidoreductase [Shewanella electrica]
MMFQWQGTQPVTLRCIDKYRETDDSVSIKLAALDDTQRFDFKPGQFINLGVTIADKREFRAYSISSLPQTNYLQLTVKRVNQGRVSNFIVDKLAIGDEVQALPPTGNFNCIDHPPLPRSSGTKVLLISAGCGITPVFAMAQHWLTQQPEVDIAFVHIARSPLATIYYDQLHTLAAAYQQFQLHLLLKHRGNSNCHQGRLDAAWLQQLVPDLKQRTVYLCGPHQFMQDVQRYLTALAFDMNHFYHESFTPSASTTAEVTPQNAPAAKVSLNVPAFGRQLDVTAGQLLADVLEQAQLPLVIACRSGICGSCKCKVNQGTVHSSSQGPLTPAEIEQGYVLACSSTIETDLDINIG